MSRRLRLAHRACAAAAIAVLWPALAAGQGGDQTYPSPARIAVGGELTATISRPDDIAFFNYTDYEHNALRVARLRLFGEWHVVPPLSAVIEVRTEDGDGIQVPGLYMRWRPHPEAGVIVQAGRIPPVFGAYPRRAYGRDNILMGVPLIYQYLTSLRPDALPASIDDVLRMRARGWRPAFPIGAQTVRTGVPLVSAAQWDTGVEGFWRRGWIDLAGAWTLGSPADPVVRDTNTGRGLSGRAAIHLPDGITFGVSAARAQWIARSVLDLLPADYREASIQHVVGTDFEYGFERWLVRAEWIRSTYELPIVTEPDPFHELHSWGGFVETRYRLHPRWQVAARFERLRFDDVTGRASSAPISWDAPVDRVEGLVGFRATRRLEVRVGVQKDWRDGGRVHERAYPALQVLYWF
jgi:hypothetical protein